jgi:phage terminase large subunit-like protein
LISVWSLSTPKRASSQLSLTRVDELPILFGGIDLSFVNDLAALCLVGLQGDK